MKPKFFKKGNAFRSWLEKNHNKKDELYVGYYKKATGKPSITWPDSVDEAICYGWIDGIRQKYNEDSYTIRFTPRKPKSTWSAVNVRKAEALIKEGRMQPAGLAAYQKKQDSNSGIYSFEQEKDNIKLPPEYLRQFKKNKNAWQYFDNEAPHYKRAAIWWVISAKREETRNRRMNTLIEDSENGLRIKLMRRN